MGITLPQQLIVLPDAAGMQRRAHPGDLRHAQSANSDESSGYLGNSRRSQVVHAAAATPGPSVPLDCVSRPCTTACAAAQLLNGDSALAERAGTVRPLRAPRRACVREIIARVSAHPKFYLPSANTTPRACCSAGEVFVATSSGTCNGSAEWRVHALVDRGPRRSKSRAMSTDDAELLHLGATKPAAARCAKRTHAMPHPRTAGPRPASAVVVELK